MCGQEMAYAGVALLSLVTWAISATHCFLYAYKNLVFISLHVHVHVSTKSRNTLRYRKGGKIGGIISEIMLENWTLTRD